PGRLVPAVGRRHCRRRRRMRHADILRSRCRSAMNPRPARRVEPSRDPKSRRAALSSWLMSWLRLLQDATRPEVDLRQVYDAIVIGSGAAGGIAAHVLTAQGMKVLMLEAGKKIDTSKELKSMEWPYQHPRRGDMPPAHHPLSLNEYTVR